MVGAELIQSSGRGRRCDIVPLVPQSSASHVVLILAPFHTDSEVFP